VAFNIAANTATTSRTGTLTIAGNTFTVAQAGASSCTYSISPLSQPVGFAGGSGTITVTTTAGCGWTATSDSAWVNILSGPPGTGSGSVLFGASDNPATTSRTATLTIADQIFTVTQGGAPCSYTVTPSSLTPPAMATTGTITVTTTTGCAWSAASITSWITASGSGTGSGSFTYTIALNTTTAARSGSILVTGNVMTVTQAAGKPKPNPPTHVRIIK